jgi:hypothetical protein
VSSQQVGYGELHDDDGQEGQGHGRQGAPDDEPDDRASNEREDDVAGWREVACTEHDCAEPVVGDLVGGGSPPRSASR